MDEILERVKETHGEEAAAKLEKLLKSSGGMPTSPQLSVDGHSALAVLAACALLIGKDPNTVDTNRIAKVAFSLANRMFNPNGELDK